MSNTPNTESTSNKKVIGDGNPDGVTLGGATTDLISFYGVTPIVQRSSASQAAVATTAITAPATTVGTSTSPWGYAGSTQANAISKAVSDLVTRVAANTTLLNELRNALVALGAIKGSA